MNTEFFINNLEVRLRELSERNNLLVQENAQLMRKLDTAESRILAFESLGPYGNKANFHMLQVMQNKLSSLTQHIGELQKINIRNESIIINLQTRLVEFGRELNIKNEQLQYFSFQEQNEEEESIYKEEIQSVLREWKQTSDEKLQLLEQNIQLKEKLEKSRVSTEGMMESFFGQIHLIERKIQEKTNPQNEYTQNFNKVVEGLMEENERLRNSMAYKDQQIIKLNQVIDGSTIDYAQMHTIESLQKQLRKKGKIIADILKRLEETEQLRKKFIYFDEMYLKSSGELKSLTEKYDRLLVEKEKLKSSLKNQEDQVNRYEEMMREEDEQKLQILLQNQACHELLYVLKGNSNLYKRDLREQIEISLSKLEMRKKTEKWTDVGELIQVNRRMRLRGIH